MSKEKDKKAEAEEFVREGIRIGAQAHRAKLGLSEVEYVERRGAADRARTPDSDTDKWGRKLNSL